MNGAEYFLSFLTLCDPLRLYIMLLMGMRYPILAESLNLGETFHCIATWGEKYDLLM